MFGIPGGCQNLLSSPEPPAEVKGNWDGLLGGGRTRPLHAKNPGTWESFDWGRGPGKGRVFQEEESGSGNRAGLWRRGGANARAVSSRWDEVSPGLALEPRGGETREEEEEDEKEEEEEEGQGAPGRGLSRARWRCGGGRGT